MNKINIYFLKSILKFKPCLNFTRAHTSIYNLASNSTLLVRVNFYSSREVKAATKKVKKKNQARRQFTLCVPVCMLLYRSAPVSPEHYTSAPATW